MEKSVRTVLYARFSSDLQRTESIDAQLRAMKQYCEEQHWEIVGTYVDEALSGTTDRRPSFQKMIADSEKKVFDVVLVHKLDRFCRNRYDSANYKYKLRKNGVKLCSVLERLDGSPESIILEGLLEAMAEYYSSNLAREVMKGLKENAYRCKHTGGIPPLGYDLDEEKRLVINPKEAECVQMIFWMYINGYGRTAMANILNGNGYVNKRGKPFTKDALLSIIKNEKYTGVYIYNRVESKDAAHKRTGRQKPADQIIRIEGGCPAIISKEVFQKAQMQCRENRRSGGYYNGHELNLCSGIIVCGCCGNKMTASRRYGKNPFTEYVCTSKKAVCDNIKEIDKVKLDSFVVRFLRNKLMNEESLRQAIEFAVKLHEEECPNEKLRSTETIMEDYKIFLQAEMESPEMRSLIDKYIAQITVGKERVTITLNLGLGIVPYTKNYTYLRKQFRTLAQMPKAKRRTVKKKQQRKKKWSRDKWNT